MINKNKTKFRPSLKLDGTLCSILTVKLANLESLKKCHKFEPTTSVLKTAKRATMEYNQSHSSSVSRVLPSTVPSASSSHQSLCQS